MRPRKALVVGIDKYSPSRWAPLECCANDALAIAEVLESSTYNFDVELLVDSAATAPSIFRSIMKLKSKHPEILLFYFAGHGAETPLGTFLVTADNQEFAEGIELVKLVDTLSGSNDNNQNIVALLDCCHAGGAFLNPKSATNEISYIRQSEVGRAFTGLSESRAVLAACGPHEFVEESRALGHGIFTNYLLEGLRGGAADHEGRVSILSLQLFLSRPFAAMTGGLEAIFRGDIHGSLVMADGLPPRLAPPLAEDVASRLDREARDHVDRYSRLVNQFDPEDWRAFGFERAYRTLTPIVQWFNDQLSKSPELGDRVTFAQAYDGLVSRRQALGTIEAGLKTEEGIIVRPLGSGGYGVVWEVRADDNQRFAYKVYHPHELREIEKIERFRIGFDAMRMLTHDRIVKVRRFSECPLGFVMDLIDGQDLRKLKPKELLDPLELTRLLVDIADTIDHAHQNDVIHRDIKPENIIAALDGDGVWKPHLTDFDLAWYSTANKRNTKSALGVVYYAAPEQHIAYDPRATKGRKPTLDVFSFGQLMHFVFTNADPDPVQLGKNAKNLTEISKDWGSNEAATLLVRLYRSATEWEPSDRIQDFAEIQARLRDIASALTHTVADKTLTQEQFLSEVRYQFSGQIQDISESGSVDFLSISGNWRLILKFQEVGSGQRVKDLLLAHFIPHQRVAMTGIANEKMRAKLNVRVDHVIMSADRARRRSGRQGVFEVFVDFDHPELTLGGAMRTRNVLVRVVSALERN